MPDFSEMPAELVSDQSKGEGGVMTLSERIKEIAKLRDSKQRSFAAEVTRRRIRELTHAELAIDAKFPTDEIATKEAVATARADLLARQAEQGRRDRLKFAAVVIAMIIAGFIAGSTLPELIRTFF